MRKGVLSVQMGLLGLAMMAVTLAALGAAAGASESGIMKKEFIYEDAPTPQCHASTIVESKDGLVAAWFGGTHERNKDVGIWVSRLVDGKWTTPVEVANGVQSPTERHPCWNPVLFRPKDAPLLLFYKVGPSPSTWWGMLTQSSDGGRSWAEPRRLPEGILGPIKNKPVQLDNGTIVCGSSTEHNGWRVHFERTPDLGKTWSKTEALNAGKKIGAIQPCILELGNDRLKALGRSRQGRIWEMTSEDGGKSWSEMTLTELPNPNSGIDAVTLRDGRHILVYNHTRRGRTPLNVAISKDGKNWQAAAVLEDDSGEYSYPALIQSADGLVHITYTWKRRRVRHVVLDPAKLVLRPIEGDQWPK